MFDTPNATAILPYKMVFQANKGLSRQCLLPVTPLDDCRLGNADGRLPSTHVCTEKQYKYLKKDFEAKTGRLEVTNVQPISMI